jgi:hypothetical protein
MSVTEPVILSGAKNLARRQILRSAQDDGAIPADSALRQDAVHDVPMHVRQPIAPPLILVNELRVIDAQQVEDRRL